MNVIFDFDSTIIQQEGLDVLAEICLQNDADKIAEIRNITNMGMTGQLSMQDSLNARLALIRAEKKDISLLVDRLIPSISKSINAIKSNSFLFPQHFYVISGGFIEYVSPVCEMIGFLKENIIANRFVYDDERIFGFDESISVSQTMGKSKAINSLNLERPVYMIGDGYTDLEVKLNGSVDYFIAFTETVSRENVMLGADAVCKDFFEVMEFINEKSIKS